jgi:hypothetical protein
MNGLSDAKNNQSDDMEDLLALHTNLWLGCRVNPGIRGAKALGPRSALTVGYSSAR